MTKYRVLMPTMDKHCRKLNVGEIVELDVQKVGSNFELVEELTESDILDAVTSKKK